MTDEAPKAQVYVITPLEILMLIELYERGWSEADDIGFRRWLEE